MIKTLDFVRGSNVVDEHMKSLILMARDKNNSEIASVFCTDEEGWQVSISSDTSNEATFVSWEGFLELFHKFSMFVAEENELLLRRCEESQGENTEEE